MSTQHKQYDKTFKREAVRLWQSSEKAAGAVEDDLGISRGLLYKWRRKIEASGGTGVGMPSCRVQIVFVIPNRSGHSSNPATVPAVWVFA